MAVRTLALVQPKTAETAVTTQYVTAAGTYTIVDKCTTTNYSAGAVTFSIWKVPSGGANSSSNLIKSKTVAAGETYTWPEFVGHYLNPGDFIATQAGTASAINIAISGREST